MPSHFHAIPSILFKRLTIWNIHNYFQLHILLSLTSSIVSFSKSPSFFHRDISFHSQYSTSLSLSSNSQSNTKNESPQKKHLVLIGGGHAHVQVIKALHTSNRPPNLTVTLIDSQERALYSGMVPGYVSCLYQNLEDVEIPLRPLAEWAGIDFHCEMVVDVNLKDKRIYLQSSENSKHDDNDDDGDEKFVEFDCVSFDIGSTTRGKDLISGVEEYTIPTRPIRTLVETFDTLSHQEHSTSKSDFPVVVVGGGAAGIELAMAIRARWNPPNDIVILNGGKALFSMESMACQTALLKVLTDRKIQVMNNCKVEEITESQVCFVENGLKEELSDSKTIQKMAYSQCLWATGAAPHAELTQKLKTRGLALDDTGWIRVGPTLQSISHPYIFAAGDCSQMEQTTYDKHGNSVSIPPPPKAGVYAVRAGPILIHNLVQFLYPDYHSSPPNFSNNDANDNNNNKDQDDIINEGLLEYKPQDDFLKLLMCGDGTALGFRFGIPIYGPWVWELKDTIDRLFMNLFHVPKFPTKTSETLNEVAAVEEAKAAATEQYDAVAEKRPDPLLAKDGADLLKSTDEGVDFQRAWDVLRDMMEDEEYREEVLSFFP